MGEQVFICLNGLPFEVNNNNKNNNNSYFYIPVFCFKMLFNIAKIRNFSGIKGIDANLS